ncbi:PQQ-dependent sugar dehydrogenase [Natribaculum luteum]|uniref:PQQ-dependent sugar dehydrogenase n=1 Tax=Natribaculum luteum TaxID=1586232 RepID=A0ABD5NXD7_9EURY|nr:PQQ-dependent sugar dehydrogenase [Natribaculum luteum]
MLDTTRRRVLAATASLSLPVAGCLTDGSEPQLADPGDAPGDGLPVPEWEPAEGSPYDAAVEATTVVSGFEIPWSLSFAGPDVFVTERDGGVLRFDRDAVTDRDGLEPSDAEVVLARDELPDQAAHGEGGTLGVATHPDYPDVPDLFIYYTADDGNLENRVVRYDVDDGDLEPILEGVPGAMIHDGGRLAFGPDDALWVTTGDADDPALAQDPSSLAGAVLRITPDGDPAPDNPDFGDESDPRTYTLGHRNPQGLAFTPADVPIAAEHGPSARDEVSVLRAGANYGWDVVRGGPDDPQYDAYGEYEAVTPPILNTSPDVTWAPSGIAFYTADAIPAWRHRLFVCGLASETLFAVTLTHDGEEPPLEGDAVRYDADWLDDRFTATAHPFYDGEFGRLRHVEQGPDGALYLLTSNRDGRASGEFPRDGDDRLLRLEPT